MANKLMIVFILVVVGIAFGLPLRLNAACTTPSDGNGVLLENVSSQGGWSLDNEYVTQDGSLIVVDVPKGKSGGTATKRIDFLDLSGVWEFRIRCRGEGIAKSVEHWLGTKFMFHHVDAKGGHQWPGATQKFGTFDWCELRFVCDFDTVRKGSVSEVVLGLQKASGKIVFDLKSLRIVKRDVQWRSVTGLEGLVCTYSPALKQAPRRRGVMLPSGACKEDDFKTLRDWGATLVRYQMCRNWSKEGDNCDLAEYDLWLDGKLDQLDLKVLPWAEKYGLDVVVDLHVAPGGRTNRELNMFYEKSFGEHFVACWQEIARRFRGRKNIYGYDLINEPNQQFTGVKNGDCWNLQRRAAEAIRSIDPTATIIIESNNFASPNAFSYLRPLQMENIIYQIHMYEPLQFTHQGINSQGAWTRSCYPDAAKGWNKEFLRHQLEDVRKFQLTHGAKIYVGEFSAAAWADGADAYLQDCISLFEEYGWDWSYHAFREWSGWSVEHDGKSPAAIVVSPDNPRKRVLLSSLKKNQER